jgi:hypothetical protein
MGKPESRKRVLALTALFVLTTIGMASWVGVTVRRDASIDTGVAEHRVGDEHLKPTFAPSADTRTTLPAVPMGPGDQNATGRLRIHCVDATTGTDLAGLGWVVGTEGRGDKLLGTGVTDSYGRASACALPAGTILVFSLRNPPHAQSFTAVHLDLGESKDVELRVGTGGRVTGRVVDDLERPLTNVEVLAEESYAPPFLKAELLSRTSRVATRTDREGHYAVENLSSRPRGVSLADGGMKIESWADVVLAARSGNALGCTTTSLHQGETKVAGDIVLPRESIWRGRVVDAEGRGVEGALLSASMQRIGKERLALGVADGDVHIPGQPGFVMLPGETLTGANGSFTLAGAQEQYFSRVIETNGASQYVRLPTLEPGKSADDILIRLKDLSVITLDLRDGSGTPARVPNPRFFSPESITRSASYYYFEPLKLDFTFDDDAVHAAELHDDGAGGFIAQVEGRIERARSYSLNAAGWSRTSAMLETRLENGGRLKLVLEEQPCVRIHLHVHGLDPNGTPDQQAELRIHACLLTADVLRGEKVNCCGLGSQADVKLVDGEQDVVLPVESRRAFHVYTQALVRASASGLVDRGTCAPGGDAVFIDIDAAEFSRIQTTIPAEHVDRSDSSVVSRTGSIRVTAIDAETGAPALHPCLVLQKPDKRVSCYPTRGLAVDNVLSSNDVPVGVWTGELSADGYHAQEHISVVVTEGAVADLGRINLQPWPCTRFLIENADGAPLAPHSASFTLRSVDGSKYLGQSSLNRDDGVVPVYGDLPERMLLRLTSDNSAVQWTEIQRDPKETVVRLRHWHDVDVRVDGAARDLPFSSLRLTVRPESWIQPPAMPGSVGYMLSSVQPKELDVSAGEPRLFRCRLGSGRYVVEGESPLFHITGRTFEVGSGDAPVRVDLESTE